MIITADIQEKSMGSKLLMRDLHLTLQENQKIGLIGRNGVGKSTMLGLLDGTDDDYIGTVHAKKGAVIISTRQEHASVEDMTVLAYILSELPEFDSLKRTIDAYPTITDPTQEQLEAYSDALDRFAQLDYYRAEDKVAMELERYQIDATMASQPLKNLSGGQKRFVELVKIAESHVDLALIDEPTNHMDYIAKAEFVTWLSATQCAVVVVTHDRDVLATVDTIIELKDKSLVEFSGNYDAYLKQNSQSTLQGIDQYEVQLKTLANLKKQLQEANRKKAGSSKTPNPFIPIIRRFEREIEKLESSIEKPSFWIDQNSMEQQQNKVVEKYHKYKAKNIAVQADSRVRSTQELITVSGLSLGYTQPLFEDIGFHLNTGEKLELRGRNGAGKSTLLHAILDSAAGKPLQCQSYAGYIELTSACKIGYYEQEIATSLLQKTLSEAIFEVYRATNIDMNIEKMMGLTRQYLFEPDRDLQLKLSQLSGGQKARFQLIKMLSNEPNLLILDEPTNHLDLPSIEELENALKSYTGAIIYVSHDNYFREAIAGECVQVGN